MLEFQCPGSVLIPRCSSWTRFSCARLARPPGFPTGSWVSIISPKPWWFGTLSMPWRKMAWRLWKRLLSGRCEKCGPDFGSSKGRRGFGWILLCGRTGLDRVECVILIRRDVQRMWLCSWALVIKGLDLNSKVLTNPDGDTMMFHDNCCSVYLARRVPCGQSCGSSLF